MQIKVLGTGCSSCKALHKTVLQVVSELKIDDQVVKEEDLMKIMNYNIISIPSLVINEKVVSSGKNPPLAEIKDFFNPNKII